MSRASLRGRRLARADAPRRRYARKSLIAEINELERQLTAMPMDEEPIMEVPVEEIGMYMDEDMDEPVEEMGMDMYMDEPIEDMVEEVGCRASRRSSEEDPDIEDEITQDYLDAVLGLRRGEGQLVTAPSMRDVAPKASGEYVKRLKRASARLDRVATYLEENGRKKLALRIDTIADAIDARIKGGRR